MQDGAIYARISRVMDATDRLGVTRQIDDCKQLAKRKGHRITRIYVDNDFSASNGKRRPDYEDLMATIRSGGHDGVITWDLDRLHRQPRELEEFIDLADRFGLELANVGGDVDLSTPQGRLTTRIKGAVAKHEAEQMGRRVQRKQRELAEAGKPSGGGERPYGFLHDRVTLHTGAFCTLGSRETIQGEVAVIRELARRVLDGDALNGLVHDLNQRGVHTTTGAPWRTRTVSTILTSARVAGLRQYRGRVIGKAAWDPILDRATWDAVRAVLTNPARRPRGITNTRKHLLSGIVHCPCCGKPLRSKHPGSGRAERRYQCCTRGCRKVTVSQPRLEAMVEDLVIGRAEQGKVRPYHQGPGTDELERLAVELAGLNARLDELGRQLGKAEVAAVRGNAAQSGHEPRLPREVLLAAIDEMTAERDKTQALLNDLQTDAAWSDALDGIEPSELRRLWESDELSLSRKRAIIAHVTENSLVVFPVGRNGRVFNPDRVSVLAWEPWRRAGTVFDLDRAGSGRPQRDAEE